MVPMGRYFRLKVILLIDVLIKVYKVLTWNRVNIFDVRFVRFELPRGNNFFHYYYRAKEIFQGTGIDITTEG